MKRQEILSISLILVLSLISIPALLMDGESRIPSASLQEGARFTWSYDFYSVDMTAEKHGTLSATVTETEWRGFQSFKFNGTMTGTFKTTSGSGTESGTWREFYRKGDLAFLDQTFTTDLIISGNKVHNTTNLHYDPWLSWIEFPLEYVNGPDKSIWGTDSPVAITSTWDRIINDDDDTRASGSDNEQLNFDWVCANLVTKEVGAGTFDTYWIREFVRDDEPRNQVTDYYYNATVGWWVEKNVYVDDDQGAQVRIKHYELESYGMNEPPSKVGSPRIDMDEDATDRSIDLDYVFSDPDSDPLTFSVLDGGLLSVEMGQDNVLTVVPPHDYFGEQTITVSAKDALNAPVEASIPVTVRPVDDPGVLSTPTLAPSSGDESTLFTYSITWTDIDTALPGSAEVRIDSVYKEMTKVSGDNVTGVLYRCSANLDPGEHTYSFLFDEIRYPSSGSLNGPSVTARELPFLKDGAVTPSQGDVNTVFTFTVTWVGPNGEVPDAVSLFLDGDKMELIGDDADPTEGTLFSDSAKLSEGSHSFHFEASFGSDKYRLPQTGDLQGPDVAGLEDPYLKGGKVDPDEGGLSTDYDFTVTWVGPNGEVPTEVLLVLDGDEVPLYREGGSARVGIPYTETMNIIEGEHSYHFKAILGNTEFRLPRSGDLDGPTVHSPAIGDCGYHHIQDGEGKATYEFYASYQYILEVYPSEAIVIIDGQGFDLSETSGSPSAGINYTRSIELSEGTYTVSMKLVVDDTVLTEYCDNLKVEIEDDGDGPGPDDGDGGGAANAGNGTIIIVIAALVVLAIVGIAAFLFMKRKGAGTESWEDDEDEHVVRTRGRKGR